MEKNTNEEHCCGISGEIQGDKEMSVVVRFQTWVDFLCVPGFVSEAECHCHQGSQSL